MHLSRMAATCLLVAGFTVNATESRAQWLSADDQPVLSQWIVENESDSTLRAIAEKFELRPLVDGRFEVIVPESRSGELVALAPDATLAQRDIADFFRNAEKVSPDRFAGYRTFDQIEALLKQFAADHPDIASFTTYGKSQEGRPLFVLKISDNVADDEDEPEVMLKGGTHGDELIGVEVVLGILQGIVDGYGTDPRITRIVDGSEIFFMPVVNPDGFTRRSRYANGVDPNREYPWPETPNRTPNACIASVISFFHAHDVAGAIDFHASGEVILWPWGYTSSPVPADDARRFADLSRLMAAENGYDAGQISDVMYIAKGSSADYFYWKNQTMGLGVEVARSKAPSTGEIAGVVRDNFTSTLVYIENFLPQ